MKLHRWKDERWPDYGLDEPSDIFGEANIEVPEELYERYKKALTEYDAVQREIANLKGISND
mgnify:FL=1